MKFGAERSGHPSGVSTPGPEIKLEIGNLEQVPLILESSSTTGAELRLAQAGGATGFSQFEATIDGTKLHFHYEKGRGATPIPIILALDIPNSFRFYKLIPLLTDPATHGGDNANSFDVVVPKLAGLWTLSRAGRAAAYSALETC